MPLKPNSKYQCCYIEFLIFEPITVILKFLFHLFLKVPMFYIGNKSMSLLRLKCLWEAISKTAEKDKNCEDGFLKT